MTPRVICMEEKPAYSAHTVGDDDIESEEWTHHMFDELPQHRQRQIERDSAAAFWFIVVIAFALGFSAATLLWKIIL